MPGQSATPRPPASRSGSALQPNSLPPRLGLGAGVRRMSPRRWLLLLTLRLQLTGAVPQRGAPASVDCELKPQVRRAGCARAASRRLSGRYLPNPTKHQVLRPQADSSGCKAGLHLPPRRFLACAHRRCFSPSLRRGRSSVAAKDPVSQSSPFASPRESRRSLLGLASQRWGHSRDESARRVWGRDLGTFTLELGSVLSFLAFNISCCYPNGEGILQVA